MNWSAPIDPEMPYWQDYLPLLRRLPLHRFPDCAALNRLLPDRLTTVSGRPLRFRPQTELPGVSYEQHIHATGEVATRVDSWHDLFNALVWARLPATKRAMNAVHCRSAIPEAAGRRGPLRDAVTLLDECGALVACARPELLGALADMDWQAAFRSLRGSWTSEVTVVVAGHAMLEKFLKPYKSMTANAILVRAPAGFADLPRETRLQRLDAALGQALLEDSLLTGPGCLVPVPLAGIPGWWADGAQGAGFYRDGAVFRAPRAGRGRPPVFALRGGTVFRGLS